MNFINEHLIGRIFPAVDSPFGAAIGWMILALCGLGVAVILFAVRSVFSLRRRTS